MKKGQTFTGLVESIAFPNKGRVRVISDASANTDASSYITVKNTIPGQTISGQINKIKHGNAEARVIEILEPSPLQLEEPNCPHDGVCGGCLYQSLPYDAQIDIKKDQIRGLFAPVLGEDAFNEIFEGIKASPVTSGYRNKMELSFGDSAKGGPLTLGMHKRGSFYDVVNVPDCQIMDADMRAVADVTLAFFSELGADYYHKLSHEGYLRHLLIRKAKRTGETLVDLVTSSQWQNAWGDEAAVMADYAGAVLEAVENSLMADEYAIGHVAGILHTRNDSLADAVMDQGTDILYGQDYFYEKLLGLKFKITPFSFFQTNSLGAEVLYETAREYILDGVGKAQKSGESYLGSTVYDLYSGTGTIAQMMAPACNHVIGVEIVKEAVEAAKENAALNGLNNCDFIAGDVLKVLDDIEEKPDYIILDPPRDGIHPKALPKIIAYGVDALVYISCKPTSLARDLISFMEAGYKPVRMCCVDMFPNTTGIETVCLLNKE